MGWEAQRNEPFTDQCSEAALLSCSIAPCLHSMPGKTGEGVESQQYYKSKKIKKKKSKSLRYMQGVLLYRKSRYIRGSRPSLLESAAWMCSYVGRSVKSPSAATAGFLWSILVTTLLMSADFTWPAEKKESQSCDNYMLNSTKQLYYDAGSAP